MRPNSQRPLAGRRRRRTWATWGQSGDRAGTERGRDDSGTEGHGDGGTGGHEDTGTRGHRGGGTRGCGDTCGSAPDPPAALCPPWLSLRIVGGTEGQRALCCAPPPPPPAPPPQCAPCSAPAAVSPNFCCGGGTEGAGRCPPDGPSPPPSPPVPRRALTTASCRIRRGRRWRSRARGGRAAHSRSPARATRAATTARRRARGGRRGAAPPGTST